MRSVPSVADGKSAGAEFEKPDSAAAEPALSARNTGPLGVGADQTPGQREDGLMGSARTTAPCASGVLFLDLPGRAGTWRSSDV